MTNLSALNIAKEVRIDEEGQAWTSLKGVAKLCGVNVKELIDSKNKKGSQQRIGLLYWLLDLTFEELPNSLKPFFGLDFTERKLNQGEEEIEIPDVLVAAIVSYYAHEHWEEKEQAKKSFISFSAIGLRELLENVNTQDTTQEELHKQLKEVMQRKDYHSIMDTLKPDLDILCQEIIKANKLVSKVLEEWENSPSLKTPRANQKISPTPKINRVTKQESLPLRQRKSSRKKHWHNKNN